MNQKNESKIKILEATTKVFNNKGMKFTMDDIAKELSMSKKTIYTIFHDKEEILYEMVDYAFGKIKESEEEVINNSSLSTIDKLRMILGVLPESYKSVDFRQLFVLKDKYPDIYAKIESHLETGWENTISLMEQGVKEGVIRPFSIVIFKATFEAAIEQFFGRNILIANNIEYLDALNELVEIMVDGIVIK